MFDWVPIRVWLLLFVATLAFVPAKYVVRHLRYAPNRRDITQPPEDLSWRSPRQFAVSLFALAVLVSFSIFIFTPTAVQVARSPRFFPALILAIGGWSLITVVRGFIADTIEPMVRGRLGPYERVSQPKRYWASMAWNATAGCFLIWLAVFTNDESKRNTLADQCQNERNALSFDRQIAACSSLIEQQDDNDRDYLAWLLASRGSAYRDQRNRERAFADYSSVIALNPNATTASYAHFYRADIFLYRYQLVPALNDLTAAIRLTPDQSWLYSQRAWVYEHLNDEARAAADRKKVEELEDKHPMIVKKGGSAT